MFQGGRVKSFPFKPSSKDAHGEEESEQLNSKISCHYLESIGMCGFFEYIYFPYTDSMFIACRQKSVYEKGSIHLISVASSFDNEQ